MNLEEPGEQPRAFAFCFFPTCVRSGLFALWEGQRRSWPEEGDAPWAGGRPQQGTSGSDAGIGGSGGLAGAAVGFPPSPLAQGACGFWGRGSWPVMQPFPAGTPTLPEHSGEPRATRFHSGTHPPTGAGQRAGPVAVFAFPGSCLGFEVGLELWSRTSVGAPCSGAVHATDCCAHPGLSGVYTSALRPDESEVCEVNKCVCLSWQPWRPECPSLRRARAPCWASVGASSMGLSPACWATGPCWARPMFRGQQGVWLPGARDVCVNWLWSYSHIVKFPLSRSEAVASHIAGGLPPWCQRVLGAVGLCGCCLGLKASLGPWRKQGLLASPSRPWEPPVYICVWTV